MVDNSVINVITGSAKITDLNSKTLKVTISTGQIELDEVYAETITLKVDTSSIRAKTK